MLVRISKLDTSKNLIMCICRASSVLLACGVAIIGGTEGSGLRGWTSNRTICQWLLLLTRHLSHLSSKPTEATRTYLDVGNHRLLRISKLHTSKNLVMHICHTNSILLVCGVAHTSGMQSSGLPRWTSDHCLWLLLWHTILSQDEQVSMCGIEDLPRYDGSHVALNSEVAHQRGSGYVHLPCQLGSPVVHCCRHLWDAK